MNTGKSPALTVIEPPVPMHEQVYRQIVHALMSGHFDPGQKLTYRKIAEQFGTSPMPVRTAFQRLQALRALELLPNGSVEVPLLTRKRSRTRRKRALPSSGRRPSLPRRA